MEQLISVDEFFGEKLEESENSWQTFDGYRIKTTERDIIIAIDDGQSCCENWGMISTEDNIVNFIGANINNVSITEGNLTSSLMKILSNEYVSSNETEFITLNTSKGSLQFAVYNCHNGYYGHSVFIKVGDDITNTGL